MYIDLRKILDLDIINIILSKAGKHPSKHLLSSFNKHGKDSFNFEVLEK